MKDTPYLNAMPREVVPGQVWEHPVVSATEEKPHRTTMLEDLKRIETMMQECVTDSDNEYGHRDADKLMTDLACTLYERCYDEEKRCVERILAMYTPATKEKWWYK